MKVGQQILMVKPSAECPIDAGQVGRIVDFDDENLWHVEWDDGRRTFYPDSLGTEIAMLRHDIVCDFCSDSPIAWTCHVTGERTTAGATLLGPGARSVSIASSSNDEWAACDACKRLIEAGNREALRVTCAKKMRQRVTPRLPLRVAIALAGSAHDSYFAVATGVITPYAEEA